VVLLLRQFSAEPTILRPAVADPHSGTTRRARYTTSTDSTCRAVTIGPGYETDATVNLGVAAHITAAAPGGPRFDELLAAAERSEAANGIWLCQGCAKLVDSDEPGYSVAVLRGWKSDAEEYARRLLGVTQGTVDDAAA
jgi:hypothetical protein